jgi:hypothetical protein
MARLLASLLVCVASLVVGGCAKGRLGVVIESDGSFDAAAVSRLHLKVWESHQVAEQQWEFPRFEANIDRGRSWDGQLPVSLIYDGYVGDAGKYHVSVAAYAGDQVVAQSSGAIGDTTWFQNVGRVWHVKLKSDARVWYP